MFPHQSRGPKANAALIEINGSDAAISRWRRARPGVYCAGGTLKTAGCRETKERLAVTGAAPIVNACKKTASSSPCIALILTPMMFGKYFAQANDRFCGVELMLVESGAS